MFRDSPHYLNYFVKQFIKDNYPALTISRKSFILNRSRDFLFDNSYSWITIAILPVILLFIPTLLNLESIRIFTVTDDSLKTLIDNRLANLATITSVTLAVVGFLMSNIALKNGTTYKVLFKYSWFLPIIYFVLSTIGCMILLALYKDHLRFVNEKYFINIVFLCSYLFILILLLIGFLFKRLLIFTNEDTIRELIRQEVIAEAKYNVYYSLLKDLSLKKIETIMINAGLSKHVLFNSLSGFAPVTNQYRGEGIAYIKDINIRELTKLLNAVTTSGYKAQYTSMYIGKEVKSGDAHLFLQTACPKANKNLKKIGNCIFISRRPVVPASKNSARNYLDDNFDDATKKGDLKMVDYYLSWYEDLYLLKVQTTERNVSI